MANTTIQVNDGKLFLNNKEIKDKDDIVYNGRLCHVEKEGDKYTLNKIPRGLDDVRALQNEPNKIIININKENDTFTVSEGSSKNNEEPVKRNDVPEL